MRILKISFSAVLMFILLSIFSTAAFAEGTSTNPATGVNVADRNNAGEVYTHKTHGNFQNNTNSCANCHSTHNATDLMLLNKSSEYELCMSCHDGTMGFYNVLGNSGAGTFNSTHTDSSMHAVTSGLAIGSAPGAVVNQSTEALVCSSCHNPHGSVNDRLLREEVIGQTYAYNYIGSMGGHGPQYAKGTAMEPGELSINLALEEDPAFAELNAQTGTGLKITISNGPDGARDRMNYSNFCSTCHDDYLASRRSGKTSGTGYTHTTNSHKGGRNCASCHYAHGTDITLLKDSAGKTVSDYVASGWTIETAEAYMEDVSAGGSALKKFTNMSVCYSCHAGDVIAPGDTAVGSDTHGVPDTPNHYYTDENGVQYDYLLQPIDPNAPVEAH